MADVQSYVFDFSRVDRFFRDINRGGCFDTADMDGVTANYSFKVCTSCPSNIDDCLDDDGTLNDNVTIYDDFDSTENETFPLLYSDGVNGDATISIANSQVTLGVGDTDVSIKALFLVDAESGYVIAYSILDREVVITNEVVFPVNGVIWDIHNEV